ncbi:hypothetical protein [Streptomyces sp.]|uniref:hypothetical protein n=1 Tax=Streptomyces sp. TaxID=1931 RepID=UPI002F9413F8
MAIPEKSAAVSDGGVVVREVGRQEAGFAEELQALYAAAGGPEVGYKRLISLGKKHGFEVSTTSLGEWLGGGDRRSVPTRPDRVQYVLQLLIPFLEDQAARRSPEGHRQTSTDTWKARLYAAQAVSKSGQGGRGTRVHAASVGRLIGMPSQALQDVIPHEFVGRDEELAALSAFVAAPDSSPAYVWWQADAWAGKTALLAWFATRCLPVGVDVVHHFIARRLGTNGRQPFLQAVGDQLASVAGRKIRAAERGNPDQLPLLFEAAARASAARHRRLVLIVDGLDEDADGALGKQSIAALLPKEPPHGMRVIVSGRRNPQVPPDVADGHPLRDAGIVRRLAPSPAARVIRDAAMHELAALLDDPRVGSPLLGLLVVAEGPLTRTDLAALVGVRPYDVQHRLRSVVGRNMSPTDIDHVALGAPSDVDTESDGQTFVLAHDELRKAAAAALGKTELAAHEAALHAWADRYREDGWPEDTPNYLLTGYTRLLERKGDISRLAALILDPRRQLRLVQRSGPDVALADLNLVAAADPHRARPRLATSAQVAVSREALLVHTRPMPRSVARTVALLGDVRRARSLAGTSPQASMNSAGLADVARVLVDTGHEQAGEIAREAGQWAATALQQAQLREYTADDAHSAASRAALALLAAGQVSAGLELLRSARRPSTSLYEAWAEAADLLAPHSPQSAQQLLDELEEQAEEQAELDDASAIAVQIWQTVAAADPARANRLQARALEHARQAWETAPTLENVSVLAAVASMLAQGKPEEAEELAGLARRHVEAVCLGRTTMSAADTFHLEFGFNHTLNRLERALTDTGTSDEEVHVLRTELQQRLPDMPSERLDHPAEDGEDAFEAAEELASAASQLAKAGRNSEAKDRLDQALTLLPIAGPGIDRAPVWAPSLAGSLIRAGTAADASSLLELWPDPSDRARAHAAMAMAFMDTGRAADARANAQQAARHIVGPASHTGPDPFHNGTWAHAAQALACVGESEAALTLLGLHATPPDRAKKAAWRKADRLARIAVASELATYAPDAASKLVLSLLNDLNATRETPRGTRSLLARLAGLLPAAVDAASPYKSILDAVKEAGLAYTQLSPETWLPETVLVHALLRTGAEEDPGLQLHWLNRDMANRDPEHFPTAALAVAHAALGDTESARHVAERLTNPHARAAALTAVAGHLSRVPVRPLPADGPAQADPFTHTVRHLADAISLTPADNNTAAELLHQSLTTTGWHHALPALAHIEPEAITHISRIATAHAQHQARRAPTTI